MLHFMPMKKILIIFAISTSTLMIAGCTRSTSDQTSTNINNTANTNSSTINKNINSSNQTTTEVESDNVQTPEIAYFYQIVGKFINGQGVNSVRVGVTSNGTTIDSYQPDDSGNVLEWTQSFTQTNMYGDPVVSRLSNGNWAITARNGKDDPRGANYLLYHESSCPLVNDAEVVAIGPSSAAGCKPTRLATQGKTSQIFSDGAGRNFIFHMSDKQIYMTYLSDSTLSVKDLGEICFLEQAVPSIDELEHGSSTPVFTREQTSGVLLSDTAIARRADGTWVLFVKGIEESPDCTGGTFCELCNRSIYRSTSTDLVHWSDLEKVVDQASIPEAVTMPDDTVWLYWQDFSPACEADDQQLSNRAPISGAYEQASTYELSDKVTVNFPEEEFESNSTLHYATNGNPVSLPDVQAQADLEACMQQ